MKRRGVPIILTDLNGGLPYSPGDRVSGAYGRGNPAPSSVAFRPLLQGWGMCTIGSHWDLSPTFVGSNG
eukprot:6795877-Pyramimonas_sp.AAC.1